LVDDAAEPEPHAAGIGVAVEQAMNYMRKSMLAASVTLAMSSAALDAPGAEITLSYDVLAGAKDDAGTVSYLFDAYNLERAQASLVSDAPLSFAFEASVSGSNTYAHGLGHGNNAATVAASASIDYGLMRAKVQGTGWTDSPLLGIPGQENRWAAVDGGTIFASTRDLLTLQSDTLPAGTSAEIEIGLSFHAATGMIGGPDDPTVWPGFILGAPLARLSFNGTLFEVKSWVNPEQTFVEHYVYSRAVGSTLPLNFDLRVQGGLSALAPLVDVSSGPFTAKETAGFADASSTLRVSVRVLTPGVTYLAQSGTIYTESLPVPELPTALLLAAGLLALGVRHTAKRRR
jgi:hypothetical protein